MFESESEPASAAIGKRGKPLPHSASSCTSFHIAVARLRWPRKTAEHWALAAGVKPRMAKYWLAKRFPVSDAGKQALRRELE